MNLEYDKIRRALIYSPWAK